MTTLDLILGLVASDERYMYLQIGDYFGISRRGAGDKLVTGNVHDESDLANALSLLRNDIENNPVLS